MINYIVSLYQGRLSRLQFILGFVYFMVMLVGLVLLTAIPVVTAGILVSVTGTDSAAGKAIIIILGVIAVIIAQVADAIVQTSVIVRRLHDLDRPWWYIVFTMVPLANLVLLIYLLVAPGTVDENDYGERVTDNSFRSLTKLSNKHRKQIPT